MFVSNLKPKISAVLFDWDATIVHTEESVKLSIEETISSISNSENYDEDIKKSENLLHLPSEKIFEEIYGEGETADVATKKFDEAFKKNHLIDLELIEGAKEVIKKLKDNDIPYAIISNKKQDLLEEEIDLLIPELKPDIISGAKDGQKKKPDAEPVIKVLEEMKIPKTNYKDVIFVGDSYSDLGAAVNSGVKPYVFGNSNRDELLENPKEITTAGSKISNLDSTEKGHADTHQDLLKYIDKSLSVRSR